MDEVKQLAENNAEATADDTAVEETTVEETTEATETVQTEEVSATEGAPQASAKEGQSDAEVSATEEVATEAPVEEAEVASNAPARDADGFSNALPSIEGEETQRKHVAGGIGYEIIYVVRTGDQKVLETTGQRVRELIESNDGAIDNVRASEVRRFAYPIKKQTEGVYVVINARFKPEVTNEMDRFFKLEESVLRHMMLKEDN